MKQSDNRSYWQKFAKLYGPFMKRNKRLYDGMIHLMKDSLSPEDCVLELACGTGQLSFPLSPLTRTWEATDFAEAMVEEARKQTPPEQAQLSFSVQDATDLTYPGQSFDVVVIANALHVMPYPEQALEEIRRVLKPEGRLFAPTFIQGTGLVAQIQMKLMGITGFHVFHYWDEASLIAFLEVHGFTVTAHEVMKGGMVNLCYVEATVRG